MEKIRFVNLVTRKIETLTLQQDKICLGGLSYQLGLPAKCYPITPSSMSQLYKLATPMADGLLLFGYAMPDTIRVLSHVLILFSFTEAKSVMVFYDIRLGVFGTSPSPGDSFKEVDGDLSRLACSSVAPFPNLCLGIGDLVQVDGKLKLFYLTVPEVYIRWARSVVNLGPPQDLLIPVRVVKEVVEDYEVAIAKLREQITAVYADTATVFENIMAQYIRQAQAVMRAQQQQPQPGGGGGPTR